MKENTRYKNTPVEPTVKVVAPQAADEIKLEFFDEKKQLVMSTNYMGQIISRLVQLLLMCLFIGVWLLAYSRNLELN